MDNEYDYKNDMGDVNTSAISLMMCAAFLTGVVAGTLAGYAVAMFV